MEMLINAVMLLHLECANPIDSPRHGGANEGGPASSAQAARSLPSPFLHLPSRGVQ